MAEIIQKESNAILEIRALQKSFGDNNVLYHAWGDRDGNVGLDWHRCRNRRR